MNEQSPDNLVKSTPALSALTEAPPVVLPSVPQNAPTTSNAGVPSQVQLTEEQQRGVDKIKDWLTESEVGTRSDVYYHNRQFKLGGYAGTGKTTIIKTILSTLARTHNIVVSAFTGKACHVLHRKGIFAQTLHSLMYEAEPDPDNPAQMIFHKRAKLEALPDLIIVDEASMVSTDLYNDLCSFNIPMLFVGDPGQLEPVGDNPNLMKEPDYVLSKIHRQAEGNPIITLAQSVRTGGTLDRRPDDGRCYVDSKAKNLNGEWLKQADQVICAKNATRKKLNSNFRLFHKYVGQIAVGEKIIVLRNNLNYGVFNGMILFVDSIKGDSYDHWDCACHDETGKSVRIPVWKVGFEEGFDDKNTKVPRKVVYCGYGYVITCHKSQGSEWKHVHVIDEFMPPQVWSMQRWRYTAITRAAERLVYSI